MSAGRPVPARAGAAATTRARIVDAVVHCLIRDGVPETSMAAIAAEAGVSKALLHYHYADRGGLLADVATQLGGRLVSRERAAMDDAHGSAAVDVLWRWLDDELARGELRAMLELGLLQQPAVRAASDAVMRSRHHAAARTVEQLFAGLGLVPRLPPALLGDASLAFADGLAVGGREAVLDPRAAFDVFWLALLSLAE